MHRYRLTQVYTVYRPSNKPLVWTIRYIIVVLKDVRLYLEEAFSNLTYEIRTSKN